MKLYIGYNPVTKIYRSSSENDHRISKSQKYSFTKGYVYFARILKQICVVLRQ
jgi:hypothetical protein